AMLSQPAAKTSLTRKASPGVRDGTTTMIRTWKSYGRSMPDKRQRLIRDLLVRLAFVSEHSNHNLDGEATSQKDTESLSEDMQSRGPASVSVYRSDLLRLCPALLGNSFQPIAAWSHAYYSYLGTRT